MKTAFVRWTAVGMVLAGMTGCFGGGSSPSSDGQGPARPEQNAPAPGKDKGSPAKDDKGSPKDDKGSPAKDEARGTESGGGFVDASKLKLVEGKGFLDAETGFLKIACEVKNETGEWLSSVRVAIRLYDASGKELQSDSITTAVAKDLAQEEIESVYSERTFVPPGETAVFYWTRDVKKIKGTYASHKLSVRARKAENPPKMALTGFKFEKDEGGRVKVSGKIENTGSVGCRSPKGVFGLYGADGQILGAVTETPDAMFQKVLGQGQSVDVERSNIDLSPLKIDSVKGWADCEEP